MAPSQTLTDKELQRLRDASIAIIREMGVECGGSNVQMAVNPDVSLGRRGCRGHLRDYHTGMGKSWRKENAVQGARLCIAAWVGEVVGSGR